MPVASYLQSEVQTPPSFVRLTWRSHVGSENPTNMVSEIIEDNYRGKKKITIEGKRNPFHCSGHRDKSNGYETQRTKWITKICSPKVSFNIAEINKCRASIFFVLNGLPRAEEHGRTGYSTYSDCED